jgi:hypothetical protein
MLLFHSRAQNGQLFPSHVDEVVSRRAKKHDGKRSHWPKGDYSSRPEANSVQPDTQCIRDSEKANRSPVRSCILRPTGPATFRTELKQSLHWLSMEPMSMRRASASTQKPRSIGPQRGREKGRKGTDVKPDRHFGYIPTTLARTNLSNFGNSRSNHPFPSSKILSCFPALIPPPDFSP